MCECVSSLLRVGSVPAALASFSPSPLFARSFLSPSSSSRASSVVAAGLCFRSVEVIEHASEARPIRARRTASRARSCFLLLSRLSSLQAVVRLGVQLALRPIGDSRRALASTEDICGEREAERAGAVAEFVTAPDPCVTDGTPFSCYWAIPIASASPTPVASLSPVFGVRFHASHPGFELPQ